MTAAPLAPTVSAGLPPDGASPPPSRGGRVARNTAWNVLGIALPFGVGILAIPVLTRELGPARFGLIGLAWAVLEYLTVLDAGLGRATVHYAARQLATTGRVAGGVLTAAVGAQVALGVLGGALLAAAAPWMVASAFAMPDALRSEAVHAFLVLALTVPFALLALALRGLLEAAERFDLAAAIRIPVSAATFAVPALAALAGATVAQILWALLVVRVLACVATWAAIRRWVPAVRWGRPAPWGELRPLATFGGWVALSNLLSPVLLLLDRFVLAAIAGVVAVGYYTGPYEVVIRLLVLPAAVVSALFPRVSGAARPGVEDRSVLAGLYAGALRAVGLFALGAACLGIVLAPDLLTRWLGADFAQPASTALRILLVGLAANALCHVPFSFVQAYGRPDVTARFHLLELAVHVPLTLVLVQRWGVAGAAAAWTTRAMLDAVLVFGAAARLMGLGPRAAFAGRWLRLFAGLLGLAGLAAASRAVAERLHDAAAGATLLALTLASAALFATYAWHVLLPAGDRAAVRAAAGRRR